MTKDKKWEAYPTRRVFIKGLATVPALPSMLVCGAAAAVPQTSAPELLPVTQSLVDVVRVRYGKQLTEDQLKELKQSLDRGVRASSRLRDFKLKNSDEPDFLFRV
ncbi:MAG: hypothetical protein HYR55_03065 [Acidobacteria bacterium]|nr:hypothetical protein [Acidobacteriota bacterium]MBI3656737.1 hypothetical protein [Acidobacteriota bacterium]